MQNQENKPMFNGKNYLSWKTMMLLELKYNDLQSFIEPEYPVKKNKLDIMTRRIILKSVEEQFHHLINKETTAYDMWGILEEQFNIVTMNTEMELY